MMTSRFSEEQIVGMLKEGDAGMKVADLCRRYGIPDAAFFTWRSRYGGSGCVARAAIAATGGGETSDPSDW